MILDDVHETEVDEENYFVSMTDMMVGLVFIFIIMLMYFALQFQNITQQMTGADAERTEILKQLKASLDDKHVPVEIDTVNGVLRLSDAILFDSGRADLKPEGRIAVGHLAEALAEVLPCYTDGSDLSVPKPSTCSNSPYRIESVYVEGHTDSNPLAANGAMQDNLDLSAFRATNTFRQLKRSHEELAALCSNEKGTCRAVLSVSGYGSARPIAPGLSDVDMRRNRRIDLRLIMVTPDSKAAIQAVAKRVNGQ